MTVLKEARLRRGHVGRLPLLILVLREHLTQQTGISGHGRSGLLLCCRAQAPAGSEELLRESQTRLPEMSQLLSQGEGGHTGLQERRLFTPLTHTSLLLLLAQSIQP